jgi:nitroimidazol reductase NimA-like FMN-containing flavoprotein (pyridoxamine 5'-phosphate oxidase superfamily)
MRRRPDRALFAVEDLHGILDAAVICHVGFVHDGTPVVIPTIHARWGSTLYLHGSPASRMLRDLATGLDVCVTVTLVDGLVLAKSWMHHSMNYRSAVIFGRAGIVDDPTGKVDALRTVVDRVQAGRSATSRPPTPKELAATLVLAMPLDAPSEWSVKAPPAARSTTPRTWTWIGSPASSPSHPAASAAPDPLPGVAQLDRWRRMRSTLVSLAFASSPWSSSSAARSASASRRAPSRSEDASTASAPSSMIRAA